MTSLSDLFRESLQEMADELQPHGPIEIPGETARRVRVRHLRTVGMVLVAIVLFSYGGFAGVRALIDARRGTPSSHVTVPPAPAASPCEPGTLTQFLLPSPHDEDILTGLAAISGQDVWAVGAQFNGQAVDPGGELALIEHWDGRSWSIVAGPSTGDGNSLLVSVSGIASDDIWAVGRFEATNDPATGPERPLIEHWEGKRWRIVASPIPPSFQQDTGIGLTGVVAIATDDAWAVGFYDIASTSPRDPGATTPQTLVQHWDGHSWTIVSSPNVDDGSLLQSVSAISPTDVWAVGASFTGFGEISRSRPLVEHWDGSEWTIVPGPTVGGAEPSPGIIETVAVIAANDVWVAWDRHLLRWDGSRWSALPSPGRILAIAAWADNDVWAAGELLANWDGKKWTRIDLGLRLPKGSAFTGLSLTPGRDLWAVGGIGLAQGHQYRFAVRKCAG